MKNAFILIILVFGYSIQCVAQPYAKGRQVINFTDPARANRQVNTEVFYPADISGNNVPVAAGNNKFPVVVFGHGFVIPVSSYAWLADSLVKYGYIVAMPTTEGSLSPSHDNFGKDLSFLCTAITSLDNNSGSFLFQRVRNKSAVAGHSMGGGASFLAASGNSPADVIFNFAAAETNPSATAAAGLTTRPALIFGGSNDCIVAPSVQQAMYSNVNFSCKSFINITDALHCQFANNNGICSFGQLTSGCNTSSISPAIVFNKITNLLLPFLDYYLKGICLRGEDFLVAYANSTGVVKQSTCTAFPSCGVLPVNLLEFSGKISGNAALLNWRVSTESNLQHYTLEKSYDALAFNTLKQELPKGSNSNYQAVDLYPFPGYSFYRLRISDKDGTYNYSEIVKVKTSDKSLTITGFHPNPVMSNLNIELFSQKKQSVQYSILGMQGQHVLSGSSSLFPGNTNIKLSLGALAAGTYLMKITEDNGKTVRSIQFIKG